MFKELFKLESEGGDVTFSYKDIASVRWSGQCYSVHLLSTGREHHGNAGADKFRAWLLHWTS